MKKKKWPLLLAIAACLALFIGYRTLADLRSDTTPPIITFSGESVQVSVADPQDALLQGVTAADSRDGDVTASLVVERIRLEDADGSLLVKYAAFDRSGNVAKAERSVRYTDYRSPRFSLTAPLLFSGTTGFDVMDVIGAADMLDGDIRHRIHATSLDGTAITTQGSHQVEFRVTNSLGDTARLTLPVEVSPIGLYNMDVTLSSYLVYLDTGADFDAEQYLQSVTRNRETVSLRGGTPRNYAVRITGDVDTRIPGVYVVDYQVTHTIVNESTPANSQVSTGHSRLIVIVEG